MTTQLPRSFDGLETVAGTTEAPEGVPPTLLARLRERTDAEVRFDAGSRAAWSTDASNYRQLPIGVVLPRTLDDVVETVAACRDHDVPITHRGGGTSLAGQSCNVAVVIDSSKYLDRVLSIDPEERTAWVEPGCNLDRLREEAAEHGLTFGPDPATHDRNTLGGMVGNNSCGAHSVMAEFYGPGPLTVDQVLELDVLTYRGQRFTVGSFTDAELEEAIAVGDERARILEGLRALRDRHRERIEGGFPDIPRRVSGYNLPRLLPHDDFDVAKALVGTEGTCVTVLRAKLRLIEARPGRALVAVGFDDAPTAGDHVPMAREHRPVAIEGIDRDLIGYMREKGLHPDDVELLPEGGGFLLVEFGADDRDGAVRQAEDFLDACRDLDAEPSTKLFTEQWEEERLWEIRESGLGATAHVPGMPATHPGWEDAAVPPERVGDYLRDFQALLDEFDYHAALYGHYGQGCIHCRIDFRLGTADGVDQWTRFLRRAAELVTSYGGSLSGEHGDGQARAALLSIMYGDELVEAFAEFKDLWDPDDRMNPGKVVRPRRPDQDLRVGPDSHLRHVDTLFAFPDDGHDFANAVSRCVGVGACRDVESGTMCPSYMATREEEDSTRGRSRMLFEMLRGDELDGWRDDHVAEALDLCLACKACKSECPVNVDMATYKAEFLSHHHRWRLRPRNDYAMSLIYWWARLASRAPKLVNAVARSRLLSPVVKWAGGVAQERSIPTFADQPFTRAFAARAVPPRREGRRHDGAPVIDHGDSARYSAASYSTPSMQRSGRRNHLHPYGSDAPIDTDRVLLWPDTFNNYLSSSVLEAATEVLEHAGYRVEIPPRPLCCGRPLYDSGMLHTARRLWEQILDTLRPEIRAGVPIVGVEPSCVAAFRDELVAFFPEDEDAQRLSEQTYLLSEFLERQRYQPPPLEGDALVHVHCHHASVLGTDAETALLARLGIDAETTDAGCCGMAGSFGFSDRHYEVSMRVGERKLLPLVRRADPRTEIVTNGFSCREQVEQSTERTPVHVAELLQRAIRAEAGDPPR